MKLFLTYLILTLALAAQNPVVRQGTSPAGPIDFSSAASTKPLRIGTTLPSFCSAGDDCSIFTNHHIRFWKH